MKKCVILMIFVLCAAILCSCGVKKKSNAEKDSSGTAVTVPETSSDVIFDNEYDEFGENSGKNSSAKSNSNSESGTFDNSAAELQTDPNSNSSQNGGSSNESSSNQSSAGESIPEFSGDDYELPFIPK